MSNIAIKVENLGKSYLVGHSATPTERYTALRDVITRNTKSMARKTRNMLYGRPIVPGDEIEEFWALNGINFEIKEGDRVGIIGRNGAGKSTLLKILSRITEPTAGRVKIKGRLASLLEVGTGFHPELTGRENIYLNGAILGMSRAEVRSKFDEIVSFSEIDKFLDTPVKRYSSGMYVRLAFAVASHLEPDILIVDEVLAVGDVAFQKKCMLRMNEVGATGRTVLFVSHNMSAVEQLCSSVIMLHNGAIIDQTNDVKSAIRAYMSTAGGAGSAEWRDTQKAYTNECFSPTHIYLGDEQGQVDASRPRGVNERILIYVEGYCANVDPALQVGVAVYGEDGALLFWSYSTDDDQRWVSLTLGENRLRLEIPAYLLNEGVYRVELGVALYHRMWIFEPGRNAPCIKIDVQGGFLASTYWAEKRPGQLAMRLNWERL